MEKVAINFMLLPFFADLGIGLFILVNPYVGIVAMAAALAYVPLLASKAGRTEQEKRDWYVREVLLLLAHLINFVGSFPIALLLSITAGYLRNVPDIRRWFHDR